MYTKCNARYDEQCGANTEMPNADFALVSSQLLGLEGLSLQQNNKSFVQTIHYGLHEKATLPFLFGTCDMHKGSLRAHRFAAVLPPLIKEHVMAIKDENYVTAVRKPAWSDTSLLCNIVKTLAEISPNYYASDWETQLKIFKYHIAKWCRVFLGKAAEARTEILKAFGCDEEWMKHRGKMFGLTTPAPKECCFEVSC